MSDHEMQFFPESGHQPNISPSQDWSPEQHSVSFKDAYRPDNSDEKADKQSLDRVWGSIEEHVSRNREYYYQNRNVPGLRRPSSPGQHTQSPFPDHPRPFVRTVPWRRLDTLVAALFLVVLMSGLLTFMYQTNRQTTQLSSPPDAFFPDAALCKSLVIGDQQVTIAEGHNGLEVSPKRVFMRQGGQVTWVNETRSAQIIVDATTNNPATKIAVRSKSSFLLKNAEVYKYAIQSPSSMSSPSSPAEPQPGNAAFAQVVIEVVNIIMIVPEKTGVGASFDPPALKVLQGANLLWFNATQDRQEVVAAAFDKQQNSPQGQKPLFLAPNACSVQRSIDRGSYTYALKSSSAKLSLYAV
jgi:hypothetical protein